MTEIGVAQRRLLDDVSSVDQPLSFTATPPTEFTQPASLPNVPNGEHDIHGGLNGHGFAYNRALNGDTYNDAQLLPPTSESNYDSLPKSDRANSRVQDSSVKTVEHPATNGIARSNHSQRTSRRSKSLHTSSYSPHDTGPLSPSASSKLNRSKSHNPQTVLVSPHHSQMSTHDELSLPAVSVEIPTTKKKRARPKKQPVPEYDEDDELSNTRDNEFLDKAPVEKQRPRQHRAQDLVSNGSTGALADGTETAQNGAVISGSVDIPDSFNSLSANGASHENMVAAVSAKDSHPIEGKQPASKEPKKKKLKRGKTTSAVVKKTYESDVEDDVIWVESRPADTEAVDKGDSITARKKPSTTASDPSPVVANHSEARESTHAAINGENPCSANNTTEINDPPAPKKRGRKRKQTAESTTTKSANPLEIQEPTSFSTVGERTTKPVAEVTTEANEEKTSKKSADQLLEDPIAQPEVNTTELPYTPHKRQLDTDAQQTDDNAVSRKEGSKGPDKHSPISSTSKVPYRIGLSRNARIAPLLKIVRK